MSKVKELLNDKESVLVFDVDGVLAVLEFGEYNHFNDSDEEWFENCSKGKNTYTEDKVISKMQNFLKNKNMDRVYVITAIGHMNEWEFKKEFVNKYYKIPKENVIYVKKDIEKKEKLIEIKKKYPELEDCKILMIDDTTKILTDIMENTNFSTVHISSFLDM